MYNTYIKRGKEGLATLRSSSDPRVAQLNNASRSIRRYNKVIIVDLGVENPLTEGFSLVGANPITITFNRIAR